MDSTRTEVWWLHPKADRKSLHQFKYHRPWRCICLVCWNWSSSHRKPAIPSLFHALNVMDQSGSTSSVAARFLLWRQVWFMQVCEGRRLDADWICWCHAIFPYHLPGSITGHTRRIWNPFNHCGCHLENGFKLVGFPVHATWGEPWCTTVRSTSHGDDSHWKDNACAVQVFWIYPITAWNAKDSREHPSAAQTWLQPHSLWSGTWHEVVACTKEVVSESKWDLGRFHLKLTSSTRFCWRHPKIRQVRSYDLQVSCITWRKPNLKSSNHLTQTYCCCMSRELYRPWMLLPPFG